MNTPRLGIIRTSDRLAFKKCRRLWNWTSHLRGNLQVKRYAAPLWMGSMMHYGLEDFYGYNQYGSAKRAAEAYMYAFHKYLATTDQYVPDDWRDLGQQCYNMLEYYEDMWLTNRTKYPTLMHNGEPQVEVNVKMPVPWDLIEEYNPHPEQFKRIRDAYDEVMFSMQFDRVALDPYGNIVIVEYKSAKAFQIDHLATDPQVAAYILAAESIYPENSVSGVLYQQHKKHNITPPKRLVKGGLSVAANQVTSHPLYKRAMIDAHGSLDVAPSKEVDFLNQLAALQSDDFDPLVRRDFVTRSPESLNSFKKSLVCELSDMLDPKLVIYPNPTRDCGRMCAFNQICVMTDDSPQSAQVMLDSETLPKDTSYDEWRKFLPDPETFTWTLQSTSIGE